MLSVEQAEVTDLGRMHAHIGSRAFTMRDCMRLNPAQRPRFDTSAYV
jgi:hypothetical protein